MNVPRKLRLAAAAVAVASAAAGTAMAGTAMAGTAMAGTAVAGPVAPALAAGPADQGIDVCVSSNLLLLLLNVSVLLGPAECPALPAQRPAAGSLGPLGPPEQAPGAPLPVFRRPAPRTGAPATRLAKRRSAPAPAPAPGRPAARYPAAPARWHRSPGTPAAPALAAPAQAPPSPAALAQRIPPSSTGTTNPSPTSTPTPTPGTSIPAAPAPLTAPAPLSTPSLPGYSPTVPFDRTLRIPLQTPRMTLKQTAVVVGIAMVGSTLAGLGASARPGLGATARRGPARRATTRRDPR